MNLFEIGEEQKLQKTVRVLWWPNITFMKDLEKAMATYPNMPKCTPESLYCK